MAFEGLLPHVDVGSGTPVALLHGLGLDARMWSGQISALRRCYRVLAPDLPGFGPNGAASGVASPADEVFRLLSSKALGPVHLVGLSYGGAVAVDLVLAHPEAVRTLVLVDALLLGERSDIEEWTTCVKRASAGDLAGARQAWLEGKAFERLTGTSRERTREMVNAYAGGHWRGTLETRWQKPEPRPLLGGVGCPTLVLVGDRDRPSFKAMAETYAATIPGARLCQMGGLGQMGPMEAPERVNEALLNFFSEHSGEALPLASSPRLEFRHWRAVDIPLGLHLWGDSRVTSFVAVEPFTALQVEERVRQEIACQARHGMQYGPIFLRASGELVGCCGFRPRATPSGVLELGFLLRPQFWGKGLATEAAYAAVVHAFSHLGARAIFAGHHPENSASRHVLEKLGFRGTHLEHYPPTGLQHPSYLLTQADFSRHHPAFQEQP